MDKEICHYVSICNQFLTLFIVAVSQADHLHSSTRPPTCPPAPACDPSAWPAYWLGEPEYSAFFAKTLENENLNVSRVTVFIHKDLVVKERLNLMSDTFSSVWLEVGLPRKKKILICNLYCEWQYLGQDSDASLAPSAQLSRWLSFLDQWEMAMQEDKEIHVMGDTNLDFLK
jgi:hypothetical protein